MLRVLVIGIFMSFSATVIYGQSFKFTGSWILQKHESITGPDYGNGLPTEAKLNQMGKVLDFLCIVPSENGTDTVQYSLESNGTPLKTRTKSGKNQTIQVDASADGKELTQTIAYSNPGELKAYRISKLQWRLINEDKQIEVMREDKYDTAKKNWSMKGTYARRGNGIGFENGMSWEAIKEKAKNEGKFIFVDCFASWCGPCKKMDKQVYPLLDVSDFMNAYFVCLKMQMDTTAKDDEEVRNKYADAHYLMQEFGVNGYPTFLFFSPEGEIVHRELGYYSAEEFISIANAALNPSKQFYTLLKNYKKGLKEYDQMGNLAIAVKNLGYNDMALTIAKDYKENYIDKLDETALLNKNLIDFASNEFGKLFYDDGSKGRFFKLFYNHGAQVDSIMAVKEYAERYVNSVISREEIDAKIWYDKKPVYAQPDWNAITATIRKKYNKQIAESLVSYAQLDFYKRTEKWDAYAGLVEEFMKLYPPRAGGKNFMNALRDFGEGDLMTLNSIAWDIFLYCDDKAVLIRALKWSELGIKLSNEVHGPVAYIMDTKANLLYKTGKTKEAIYWEQKAAELDEKEEEKRIPGRKYVSPNHKVVEKMGKGTPTWPVH